MLDLLFWSLALFSMLLGFLGWIPCAHNPAYACKLDYAHVGLFMRAHDLPRNPNPSFFFFLNSISYFTCNASILNPFPIYSWFWASVSHVCLFACFSHVKLWFILIFFLRCHEHAFPCSCIDAIGAKIQ